MRFGADDPDAAAGMREALVEDYEASVDAVAAEYRAFRLAYRLTRWTIVLLAAVVAAGLWALAVVLLHQAWRYVGWVWSWS